ncbi:MAG: FAD-dependent 5-carboxymethylaminomethyl-2-thiouridine(34) oxidoreductase MnmC, partial [Psychromonas sp.]
FGDVISTLPELYINDAGLFDCWYLDGFAPSKNPEMWSESLFEGIAKSCKQNASIATFTAAGFVRRSLAAVGFDMQKRKGYGKKREMLVGKFSKTDDAIKYGQHYRQPMQTSETDNKDIAIVGGGIASACLTLSLLKRGYRVSLYCNDSEFAIGASGNRQGALYPLLNEQHDSLSQFFANSFLYARNYVETINQVSPFDYDFSGLLQLYYDSSASKKLDKILRAQLPESLVHKVSADKTNLISGVDIEQAALFYPLGGWLSPKQMVKAIFKHAQASGDLTIYFDHQLLSFTENTETGGTSWDLKFANKTLNHHLLILTSAINTLDFEQCKAIPLSAARGQVTHIPTTPDLKKLKVTLCHEGYLTPENSDIHCMGATFKRHQVNQEFIQSEQLDNKNKLQKCINDKAWTEDIDIEHSDANVGIRCTTRDHFPYVGAVPDYQATQTHYIDAQKKNNADNAPFHNNLYMLTGLGSRGLCTAPLLAEMLVGQINSEPLPFASAILNAMQGNRQWISYLKKGKKLKF